MNPDDNQRDIDDALDWLQEYTPAERLLILESLNREIRNGHVEYGDMIKYEALTDWFKRDGWKYANNVPESVENDIIEEDGDVTTAQERVLRKAVEKAMKSYEGRDKDIYPDLDSYVLGFAIPAALEAAKDYADNAISTVDRWTNQRIDGLAKEVENDLTKAYRQNDAFTKSIALLQANSEEKNERIIYLENHVDAIQTRLNDSNDRIAALEHTVADLLEKMTFLVASKEAANELDEVEF